ncbi:MAG: Ig-like domain-containing protein, partial [Chloroflexota bacterium]|nr:Ig-like domain-containing protein [Chloroflexota bacterium]
TITIQADAADNTGVNSVQFFVDGASIGTDSTAADGWSLAWNTVGAGNGNHTLTARALDRGGNPTLSAPVPVVVNVPTVVDIPVATGADDTEEGPTGTINQTSSDLDLLTNGTSVQRAVALRFTGVNVPRDADITDAYVQFQADEAQSVATNLTLKAQASDNAPALAGGNSNITTRPVTTASTQWAVPAWTAGQRGAAQRTPNLRSVVQEIVDRPGWSPGNAMVVVITGTGQRVAEAFEGGAAPMLHIEHGPTDASPDVSLTAPADGSTVAGEVALQANASDDNGVTQVEFRVDNTTIATDTSAPYSASWNTLAVGDGAHAVRAIATDTAGQSATATANVTVDNVDDPPTVTLTAPAEGSTVGGTVQMQANASDDVGVTQVEFRAGGTTMGTDTNAPFTASWDTTTAGGGLTTVTAIATDTSAKTTSDSNDVTVDNSPPTVAITSPAGGATVSGTITIQADAADNTGVNSVQFFVDGASIGTDSTAADGWSLAWNTVGAGNGNHTLTARALDRGGNPTLSAPVPVAIENALVLDIPVTVSADDAEQKLTNNSVRTNSSDLELVVDKAATQLIGLRYQGITLPRGATITNAYIQFQAAKTNSEATSLNLRAQAADDAPVFTTATSNLSSRPLTTASVPWTPAAWTQVNQRGLPQRSTNISPVLQEIVDRVGWSPGNSMVFIINGTGLRRAYSFDGGAEAAPSLHIEYANPTGP